RIAWRFLTQQVRLVLGDAAVDERQRADPRARGQRTTGRERASHEPGKQCRTELRCDDHGGLPGWEAAGTVPGMELPYPEGAHAGIGRRYLVLSERADSLVRGGARRGKEAIARRE